MNDSFKKLYQSDTKRYSGKPARWNRKFHLYLRKVQTSHSILTYYYGFRFRMVKKSRGIEILRKTKIGPGLYVGHPYAITINEESIIGSNCNIHKGVTIGQENRGGRKGAPKIGNSVWIGINSTIVGNITIGDDVLIAPNTYINCDVPSHSIVLGNPCIIKQKENATEGYINNKYIEG